MYQEQRKIESVLNKTTTHRLLQYREVAIALTISGLFFVVVNWPVQMVNFATGSVVDETFVDFAIPNIEAPILAGWPFCYLIEYRELPGSHAASRTFSIVALLYNLLIAVTVVTLLTFYISRRSSKNRAQKISIADLLIALFLIAIPFGWWNWTNQLQRADDKLAKQIIAENGICRRTAWIPAILSERVPLWFTNKFQRIRHVRIEQPSQEVVSQLANRHALQLLRIGGSSFDSSTLYPLAGSPHLKDLRISGRALSPSDIAWIGTFENLNTLNLQRTNITDTALNSCTKLNQLRNLGLVHSSFPVEQLNSLEFTDHLRSLWIGHPQGQFDVEIKVDGWPELESFEIGDFDMPANGIPLKVHLSDLPKLKAARFDVFQKFGIHIEDAPLLETITTTKYNEANRRFSGRPSPGLLWVDEFVINGPNQLKGAVLYGPDITRLSIPDGSHMRQLAIGSWIQGANASSSYVKHDPQNIKSLLEGIASCKGLRGVDLISVPLEGADLSPLGDNKSIEELLLGNTQTSIKQWRSFAELPALKILDVQDCEIDFVDIDELIRLFPKLESLSCTLNSDSGFPDFDSSQVLKIQDNSSLRSLDLGNYGMQILEGVSIKNVPNLAIELQLANATRIDITNAPSITGFLVDSPLPKATQLRGVRDLDYFAVGGDNVNDSVVDCLQGCKELTTLTLAYTAVTSQRLERLPPMQRLQALTIAGTSLTDETIKSWSSLESLRYLNLQDSKLSSSSLSQLCQGKKIEELVLSRAEITPNDLSFLSELPKLTSLSVSQVGISPELLEAVLNRGNLLFLDLSDCDLTDKHMEVLTNANSGFQWISLQGSQLKDAHVIALLNANPGLLLELSGIEVSSGLMTRLLSTNRICSREQIELTRRYANSTRDSQLSRASQASIEAAKLQNAGPVSALINIDNIKLQTDVRNQPR